jgi:hypothetical protein
LSAELARHRLIDQYMPYACPNVMGRGNHLFRDISEPVTLTFERTVPFSSGVNLRLPAGRQLAEGAPNPGRQQPGEVRATALNSPDMGDRWAARRRPPIRPDGRIRRVKRTQSS